MNCPACENIILEETKRGNVMIDICPNCKGIWLDRGELAKIIQGLNADRTEDLQHGKDSGRRYVNPEQKKKNTMVDVLSDLLLFW